MRSLSDTITRLAALRAKPASPNPGDGHDRLSDLTDFGSNPGALRARFYIPDDLPRHAPLVVVLHGCTQTAAGYDHGSGWSQLADEQGFALLFPEQRRANNASLCFNWFVPGDIQRNRGEALSIRQMIETFVVAHGLDRRRIFVTGLSAGGAMTSVMLATYPDIFAGGAIIAGLPFASAATIPEAFESMRGHDGRSASHLQGLVRGASTHKGPWPAISIWQGSTDSTVDASNAEAILGQWREVHGLRKTPARTEIVDGHRRRVWCDADGRPLIEEYIIAGMGHGTPLKTAGDEGLGKGGAFMLDVGISSTRHIARFWGLPKSGEAQTAKAARARLKAQVPVANGAREREPVPPAPHITTGVKTIIEDALRKVGLMR